LVRLHDQRIASRSSSLAWGAALGMFSAFLLACLRQYSDSAFRSEIQVSDHFGLPVIGYVPAFVGSSPMATLPGHGLSPSLDVHYRPAGLFADSIHCVSESIRSDDCGNGLKVLQVTSPSSSDNKSVIAANLAIAMAQSGMRVLLVDTDFNCPEVHRLFGYRIEKGIAWLLQRLPNRPAVEQIKKMLDEVIIESEIDNLSVIGMGNVSSGFSASRHFDHLSDLTSVWSDLFDMVIIDSQSMLAANNPMAVTLRVDAVLVVIRLTRTAKWRATRAKPQLDKLQSNVLGIVVNGVDSLSAREKCIRTRWQDRFHRL
jgi:capsular exopolysaccharide synthesis family protein